MGHHVLSAYVEIVFDNSDGRLPVEKPEVGAGRADAWGAVTGPTACLSTVFPGPKPPAVVGFALPPTAHAMQVEPAALSLPLRPTAAAGRCACAAPSA